MLQCVELGDALEIHDRVLTDFYARRPHMYIPLPGRTRYLEVGMCMSYVEVVVCVYGHLTWSGIYIHMCIFHVRYTYTHIIIPSYRYNTRVYTTF